MYECRCRKISVNHCKKNMYGIHAKNCSLAETFEFAKSHQNSYENEEEGPSRLKIWSLA